MGCVGCCLPKNPRSRVQLDDATSFVTPSPGSCSTAAKSSFTLPNRVPKFDKTCLAHCKNLRLFEGMDPVHMQLLAGKFKLAKFKAATAVIGQGEPIMERSCLYIVDRGTVTVKVYGAQPFDLELGPGSLFGEVGLLFDTARTAAVMSNGCQLFTLSRAALQKSMHLIPFARLLIFCRKQMLLQNLSDTELIDFTKQVRSEHHQAGTTILREGDPGHSMYIIRRGDVAVLRNGREVAVLGRHHVLGQRALHGKPRTATCVAKSLVEVIAVDDDVMDKLSNPVLKRILCCDAVVAVQQHSRVFGSFDQYQLEGLLRTIEENVYERGDTVLFRGQAMHDLWVVRDGTTVGRAVAEAGGFQYFGSITGHPCPSDVVVTSPTASIVKCTRDSWMKILQPKTASQEVSLARLEMGHEVGAGNSGKVHLARSRSDASRTYAVKSIPKTSKTYKNSLAEGAIMRSLNNPFCVRLYNLEEDDTHFHLIMEYVPHGELFHQLQKQTKFGESQARFYFACVVMALDYLHRNGIVYRDLKPENLLLDSRGYVKMTDFGFAKRIGNTRTYTICGTPEYQAPEVMQDQGSTTAADYWSLGVLAYEMLTGVSPFLPMTSRPHEISHDPWKILHNAKSARYKPPAGYENTVAHNLITRLLQPDPADRLCDVAAIKDHRWFAGFDWRALSEQRLTAPKPKR